MNLSTSNNTTSTIVNTVPNYSNSISLVIMLALFSLIFYIIILRPYQQRTKEHKKIINSIEKGDEILTNSGIIGRVTKVSDSDYISIALNDTTEVIIKREFVSAILPRGTIKAL